MAACVPLLELLMRLGSELEFDVAREVACAGGTVDVVWCDPKLPLAAVTSGSPDLRDVPVLICSTSGYDKDMERAKALGAIGYLAKPAELDKLKPFLERIGGLCLFRDDGFCSLPHGRHALRQFRKIFAQCGYLCGQVLHGRFGLCSRRRRLGGSGFRRLCHRVLLMFPGC